MQFAKPKLQSSVREARAENDHAGQGFVSPNLEVGGDYQYTRLRFDVRAQAEDIHLARLRVRGALNTRASGNAFIRYNSTTERLAFNFGLRYNFSEGTDVWLVYDEAIAIEGPELAGVRAPLSAARALVLKYTHTFQF